MKTLQQFITDTDPAGIVLLAVMYDRHDTDFLEWEPEIRAMAWEKLLGDPLTPTQSNKFETACQIMLTDAFNRDPASFAALCRSFNGISPGDGSFRPPTVEQMIKACTESRLLVDSQYWKFSPEVSVFAGKILEDGGVYVKPSILSFADMPDRTPQDPRLESQEVLDHKLFWDEQQQVLRDLEQVGNQHFAAIASQLNEVPLANGDRAFSAKLLEAASKLL